MDYRGLDPNKVKLVARTAKFLVDSELIKQDETLAYQIISEGIRKLHDKAKSKRGEGKYLGHIHWSREALKLLEKNGGRVKGITTELSHEHVIPISIIVKKRLFKLHLDTPIEEYIEIITSSKVAIITRSENKKLNAMGYNKKMPNNWDEIDPFARYKSCDIYKDLINEVASE